MEKVKAFWNGIVNGSMKKKIAYGFFALIVVVIVIDILAGLIS